MYYTRNLTRPFGTKRFYDSPQALILAFGGTSDRTVALPLVKVKRGEQKPVEHETVEQAEIAQEPGEQEPVETSAD